MRKKKWLGIALAALALVVAGWTGLNLLADPFGVFGTALFRWDGYAQTLNPYTGKITYLSRHWEEYDSYIIGSSSAGSYEPQVLEQYLGGSFYNLFHEEPDPEYDQAVVSYLLSQDDDVRCILLVLGLEDADAGQPAPAALTGRPSRQLTGENALSYYARFLFANPRYALQKLAAWPRRGELARELGQLLPESGCYDTRLPDAQSVGELSAYLTEHAGAFSPAQSGDPALSQGEACAQAVANIRRMCSEAGVELHVLLTPACQEQLALYSPSALDGFFTQLAQAGEYWNFSISPLSYDQRYFYDSTHLRTDAARLVLERMFTGEAPGLSGQFGVLCQGGTAPAAEQLAQAAQAQPEASRTATVPILLYHHLSETQEESSTTLHPAAFRRHMELLRENGYHVVGFSDLIAFVEQGTSLPDRPVVITFDDGYLSNYEYALPVLEEYGYPATIFTIGSSIGHDQYYKDTQYPLTPHFGQDEIDEMLSSGLISLESHTYDMHQWAPFEPEGAVVRPNILPLESESEADYTAVLMADVERQRETFRAFGIPDSRILAFPTGLYTPLTDAILRACGFQVTVTTDETRVNTLVYGLSQSLIDLGRMNISGDTTEEEILTYLSMS